MGGSIGLSAAGIAIAAAGGATAAGASITDSVFLQRTNVKKAQEKLTNDYERLSEIVMLAEHINKVIRMEEYPGIKHEMSTGLVGEVLIHTMLRGGNTVMKITEAGLSTGLEIGAAALRVGGITAKSIAAAGIVLNIALIPIDLVEIVLSSISLKKHSKTDAVEKLHKIAEQLETQKESIAAQLANN